MSKRKIGCITMKWAICLCAMSLAWSGITFAACPTEAPTPPKNSPDAKAPRALIKTKFGEMEVVLYPELAPYHVASFMALAKCGFYNGALFHRVIPGFMIQGGDPNTKDPSMRHKYGTGGPGYTLPAEFNKTPHEPGILSAARTNDPDSAGSQFFIMVAKTPHLDGTYTVFGEVVKGLEVTKVIVSQPRDTRDNPLERIEMTIEIVE